MDEKALERSRHVPTWHVMDEEARPRCEKEAAGMGAPGPHTTAESTHSLVQPRFACPVRG